MFGDLFELVDRIRKESRFLNDPIRTGITTDRGSRDEGVVWHGVEHTTNVVMMIAINAMKVSEVNYLDCLVAIKLK